MTLPAGKSADGGAWSYRRLRLPNPGLALKELAGANLRRKFASIAPGCASVGLSMDDPAADFRGNTLLVFEMLEALRRHVPRCRFLLLSSAAVHGDPGFAAGNRGA